MSSKLLVIFFFLFSPSLIFAQQYKTTTDVAYCRPDEPDSYKKERCKLDIYIPTDRKILLRSVGFMAADLRREINLFHLNLKRKV